MARRDDLIARHGELCEFAERTRANLYFGVCPRSKVGDAADHSIRTVRCVWCDIDRTTVAQACRRWHAAAIPQPSIIVSSGTGIHGYWLLERSLDSNDDRTRLRAMLPGFYASFDGDHVQNLSRVMRLPATLNYKNARNGEHPRSCTLCTCDSRLRYPLEMFSRWIAPAEQERLQRMPSISPTSTGGMPAEAILSSCPEAVALAWQLKKPSRDRSRRDFAIVCELLRLGITKEEIWELVAGSSKFQSAGRPYFDLTIANAERKVAPRRDYRTPITYIHLIGTGLIPRPNGCLHAIGLISQEFQKKAFASAHSGTSCTTAQHITAVRLCAHRFRSPDGAPFRSRSRHDPHQ